jgi:hypothetical protein
MSRSDVCTDATITKDIISLYFGDVEPGALRDVLLKVILAVHRVIKLQPSEVDVSCSWVVFRDLALAFTLGFLSSLIPEPGYPHLVIIGNVDPLFVNLARVEPLVGGDGIVIPPPGLFRIPRGRLIGLVIVHLPTLEIVGVPNGHVHP